MLNVRFNTFGVLDRLHFFMVRNAMMIVIVPTRIAHLEGIDTWCLTAGETHVDVLGCNLVCLVPFGREELAFDLNLLCSCADVLNFSELLGTSCILLLVYN